MHQALDPVAVPAAAHLAHEGQRRAAAVDQQEAPGREEAAEEPGGQEGPGAGGAGLHGGHQKEGQGREEALGQQGGLQVGEAVCQGQGEHLGVEDVAPLQVADLKAAVHAGEEEQHQGVHGHHQPVAPAEEGRAGCLGEIAVPGSPVDPHLHRKDGCRGEETHHPFVLVIVFHLKASPFQWQDGPRHCPRGGLPGGQCFR